jgi:hypothetical protein
MIVMMGERRVSNAMNLRELHWGYVPRCPYAKGLSGTDLAYGATRPRWDTTP